MTTRAKPAKAQRDEVRSRAEAVRLQPDSGHAQADLNALTRQLRLVTQLLKSPDTSTAFGEVVSAAIEIVRADAGTLQLWDDESKSFRLATQSGFDPDELKQILAASISDGSPHLRAIRTGGCVVVDDLEIDCVDDGTPRPGYRAVQSTPLLRRGRGVIGALATYHRNPHRPSERELHYLDLYARQAADFVDHLQQRESATLANRRKDEFLAVLAHELRSPLAPIGAGLELLRTTVNDPAIVHEVHQIMQRQLEQLTALIDDVFDISCITKGVFSMKSRRIDMNSVVESAAEQLAPAVKAAGHTLTLDVPDRPIFFDGDPRRIVQALSNLLDNAIKFTPRGGTIRLTARRDANTLVVSVEDNGMGIAPAELERVLASGDGPTPASSGIGLTLVKSLVELHGGTVSVHSAGLGLGARFTIRLPAAAESVQTRPQVAESQPTSGLRILVVDDNGAAADMLAMILESYGNELLTAYSGQKAIELAETHQPDVILLDLGMPVIDGYEAARHIRRQPQGQEPMLIALTGWGQERDKERAHEAGFDHYVVKPAKAEDLRALLAGAKRHGR